MAGWRTQTTKFVCSFPPPLPRAPTLLNPSSYPCQSCRSNETFSINFSCRQKSKFQKAHFSRQRKLVSVTKMRRYDHKLNLKEREKKTFQICFLKCYVIQHTHLSCSKNKTKTKMSCKTIIAFENAMGSLLF